MPSSNDIMKTFKSVCGEDFPWKGKWISDDEWAKYVQPDNTILLDNRRRAFNKAISTDATYGNLLSIEEENDLGLYRHLKFVEASNQKKRTVSFYYISRNGELPPRPTSVKEWQAFYKDNLIRVSARKRKAQNDAQQQPQQPQQSQRARVTPTPGDQETATIRQSNVQDVSLESVTRVLPTATDAIIGRFWVIRYFQYGNIWGLL